jgi:hypothetical protein
MRASWIRVLLVTAAVGLAVAGCASQPKEDETARAETKPACSDDPSNPLHLTTLRKQPPASDPDVQSLLNQSTDDPQLAQINRQMYQTLHALDVELRRQQQVAACEQSISDTQPLQAQSTQDPGNGPGDAGAAGAAMVAGVGAMGGANAAGGSNGGGGANGAGGAGAMVGTNGGSGAAAGGNGAGGAGASGGYAVSGMAASASANAAVPPAVIASSSGSAGGTGVPATAARTSLIRKSSVSPTGTGGGNGATAQKVSAGSDNDIVARRLRKAADQETDPVLKAKLLKEYAQYQQANATK